jgi:C4-dicarboxylate transporter, DctQ subunit
MVGNTAENANVDDSLLSKLDQGLSKIEDFLTYASAFVILGLMLFGTMNALGRKFFSTPVWGYTDLVTLFMVAFSFLAVAGMQRVGGHIRMELFVRKMSGRMLWVAEFVGVIVALFIMCVLLYYSSTAFMRAWTLGDSTIDRELATWPSKMWVPIAFAVLIARLILQSWGYLRLIINPNVPPIAVPMMHTEQELAIKEIEDTFGDDDTETHELKA